MANTSIMTNIGQMKSRLWSTWSMAPRQPSSLVVPRRKNGRRRCGVRKKIVYSSLAVKLLVPSSRPTVLRWAHITFDATINTRHNIPRVARQRLLNCYHKCSPKAPPPPMSCKRSTGRPVLERRISRPQKSSSWQANTAPADGSPKRQIPAQKTDSTRLVFERAIKPA